MRLFGKSKKRKTADLTPARRRVLFVSHEATRTGAPKIILNILKHFSQNCDIQCESVLQTGGHLATEFEQHSIVDCLNIAPTNMEEIPKRVSKVITREKNNAPILAICNSMESRYIAADLAKQGIPCICLLYTSDAADE